MKLTEKNVAKLPVGKERAQFYDDDVRGFLVRVEPNGRKSFGWYVKVGGRVRYRALGEFPYVGVGAARDEARKLVGIAATWRGAGFTGPDPFEKEKCAEPASTPTFAAMVEHYIENHLRAKAFTPERAEYHLRLLLKNHFASWLARPIDEITVDDVLAAKNACGKQHFAANSVVEFTSRVFSWSAGKKDGKLNFWKVENPAKDVSLFPHGKKTARKRFLQPDELLRFEEELKNEPDANVHDSLSILLATGARRGNVNAMRWQDVSLERRTWSIPMSKSGEGYDCPLTPAAIEVLERREKTKESEFVFPANSASGHIVDIKKKWHAFRKRAGFPDVRIHDIRRTRGSYAAIAGESLQKIAELLGHKSLGSTEIYARLNEESLRGASEAADATMERMKSAARKRMQQARTPRLLTPAR